MSNTFDLAIVGSGFAGSLLSMIARRLGRTVILLEKFRHPRFVIGESSTPLANLLLEELSSRYDLPRLMPLTSWGSWQREYPEIAVGLKRGFTFYHHDFGKPFSASPSRDDQLLVAASPRDEVADTHWYRPDFDHFLVREARRSGVEYLDEVALDAPEWADDEVVLSGARQGEPVSIRARFVIDATGPRGFLHGALNLPERAFEYMPATQGLYTHFTGVRRLEYLPINHPDEEPPYPVDDAAVHHIFDGGWVWVLRFNNGITSAGAAVTDELAGELRLADGALAWERLLCRLPTVSEQFAGAKALFPFVHSRRLSFRSGVVVGRRWAMLPSAAGFIDPLLSTGFPLALLGIARLSQIIERDWDSDRFGESLRLYAEQTERELSAAGRLVGALYANMKDFELFASLSLLYFAAASFAESARRLGRAHLAGSFLLIDHPRFGPESRSCVEQAVGRLSPSEKAKLARRIRDTIEPVDVAGLGQRDRRNWYPVKTEDLFDAAGKLGVGEKEIEDLLQRLGL
ncbi:MAG TPA: tryptophan 7-halogenase [Blastocatellia bacterium]|nr:tryptophan 7-halogenase [Blastocatellia bacterium]